MATALPVLLSELVEAFDDSVSWTRFHYLDRQTGEVGTALSQEVDKAGNFADVRSEPQRYVRIKELPTWLRVQARVQFVEQKVEDPALRMDLMDALQGDHAVPDFERLLRNHPDVFEAFSTYRKHAFADAAREWLATHKLAKVELK